MVLECKQELIVSTTVGKHKGRVKRKKSMRTDGNFQVQHRENSTSA